MRLITYISTFLPVLFFSVNTALANVPQSPFPATAPGQPTTIDRETMAKEMEARSQIAELNRAIAERKTQIIAKNPKIKELQEKMRLNQEKIDKLLAEDKELQELQKKQSELISDIPTFNMPTNAPPLTISPPVPEQVGKPQTKSK